MKDLLINGALSPRAQMYFSKLMSPNTGGLSASSLTDLMDRHVCQSEIGPATEQELSAYQLGQDPYLDMFDEYTFVKGGCLGLRRLDIARASRLWSRLVEPDQQSEVLSFDDMINLALRFFAEPQKPRTPDPIDQSLYMF